MKVILFGATGMVGQGVLRECLLDPAVESVLAIGRNATGQQNGKLLEVVHKNFLDFTAIEGKLSGYDACFYCLGISAVGMSEQDYERVTYGYALGAAQTLARLKPAMTFEYISGTGTDSTEKGRIMWARVKGKTENALRRLPFKAVYALRPGYIQPLDGITSKTGWYRAIYAVVGPLYPVLKAVAPNYVTTTVQIGKAMIAIAKHGSALQVLENRDINRIR
jgi:uncharacterized protein YbjT (DUF2867 family)